jgi:hypothetical protein
MRSVTAEADHSDLGNIGVEDFCLPPNLGDAPRVRRPQLDLNPMLLEDLDCAAVATQAFALKDNPVVLRGVSRRGELKHRAFRAKTLEGRQITMKTANAGRLVHGVESALD